MAVGLGIIVILFIIKRYFSGGQYKQKNVDLTGKYAVVTGGNSGIGAETVKYLCSLGIEVTIGARDRNTAEAVIKACLLTNPKAKVEFIPLDLSSRDSIKSFASSIQQEKIDYLINNAGLMAIPRRKLTK